MTETTIAAPSVDQSVELQLLLLEQQLNAISAIVNVIEAGCRGLRGEDEGRT